MPDNIIKLGSRDIEIKRVPLGRVKKIVAAVHRANVAVVTGFMDEAAVDDLITVLAEGTGIAKDELEKIDVDLLQLNKAYQAVIDVIGLGAMLEQAKALANGGPIPGELSPVAIPASIPSMKSTAPSAPISAGDGTTSTST